MKKLIIMMLLLTGIAGYATAVPTVVNDIFEQTYNVDISDIQVNPCSDETAYNNGNCTYYYHCMVLQPRYSNDLRDAVERECVDMTGQSTSILTLRIVPPRGEQYIATSFVGYQECVADCYPNCDTQPFHQWSCDYGILENKWEATAIVSLCDPGKMLKDNLCYDAQPVCIDPQNTNMCDNPYQLFVLDRDGDGIYNYNQPADFCADRNGDLICDQTESYYCSDIDQNGVCDYDDVHIINAACIDANQNFVCDSVESEGAFCQFQFQPVCVGNITYPNQCFAEAAGHTSWSEGTCAPLQIQCYQDNDCQPVCEGVSRACVNNLCNYMGECNPQKYQCAENIDCPDPYCVGVTKSCEANKCVYVGTCINKPTPPPSFWDKLLATFMSWIQQVRSFVGW